MARYRIGNDLTILWKVYDKEGKALFLNDKEVHLFYTCERGRFEADINIQEDNIIVWNFYGSLQKTLGEYSLTLEIFQSEGMRSIKKDVCGAFVFVAKDCEADVKDTTVSLNGEVVAHQEIIKTNLDVCRVSPVIPYVVRDENGIGYWYVDGVNTGDRSTGESAYEYAVSKGYQGTEEEFASILALVPNKADKRGRYPEMSVGFADNLVGRGESVPASFTFRATGGKSIKDGTATIKELLGNAVVWNQLLDNHDLGVGLADKTETDTEVRIIPTDADSNRFGNGVNVIEGHYYLQMVDILSEEGTSVGFANYLNLNCHEKTTSTSYVKLWQIAQASATGTSYVQLWSMEGTPYRIRKGSFVLRDLTQMFQAGNEPKTIGEYNARKPIVADEYAYNKGEVIAFNGDAIKSVGDNALSERSTTKIIEYGSPDIPYTELNTEDVFLGISCDGYNNPWTISNLEVGDGTYSFNTDGGGYGLSVFVKVLPNQEYSWSAETNGRIDVGFYDANKMNIGYLMRESKCVTPQNCEYIALCLRDDEDISIRLTFTNVMLRLEHSGWMTDIGIGYQPYWEDTLQIDSRIRAAFTDENGVYKGMHKWDKVYNKDGKGYIVKGTGVVDLGNLDWRRFENNGRYYFNSFSSPLGAVVPSNKDSIHGICSAYEVGNENKGIDLYKGKGANVLLINHGYFGNIALEKDFITIHDDTYTDAASFKSDMAEVKLYYELAKPTIEVYDTPFNFNYRVADFGTEELISEQDSAPFKARTIYQFNAVDQIRENYNEIEKIKAALAKAGITIDL